MSQQSTSHGRPSRGVPVEVANQIDEICDRFEAAWRSGSRPTLEDFLDDTASPNTSQLFAELVRIDIEYRAQHGEVPCVDEYASHYPEFADVLTSIRQEAPFIETVALRPAVIPARQRRIGRYDLVREVGRGGFGTVWKAWDTQLRRTVALKLPRERLEGLDHQKAFLREARAAAELEHPHIVPVLDSGTEDDTAYIVSRFVDGISLRQWMKVRTLTPREVAGLCAALADAVDHARARGVIHRDLKPSNVLIDGQGQPHITDFGLATRKVGDVTLEPTGSLAGTPAYMSPEQVLGTPKLDHRSDVYSLGVTLYELLTGRVPFSGDQATVLHQILHVEPEPLRRKNRQIPADLETICLKAMAKDRGHRYQTAGELAEDLRRFLQGHPIAARRVGRVERAWRWSRRNPLVSGALALAIVATSAALSLAFYPRSPALLSPAAAGHRVMMLATDPPGARVVFYRLDDRTGEPDPSGRIEAPMRSPVRIELPPGDYFIVAALDDGRFHEVYRRVPPPEENIAFGYRNLYWTRSKTEPGALEWTSIVIPAADVAKDMAVLEGRNGFPMGRVRSTTIPLHQRTVTDLRVDPCEVTVAQVRERRRGQITIDRRYKPVPEDHAATLPFDEAVGIAEVLGKRLPTEAEWEFIATHRGGAGSDREEPTKELIAADAFGPVGEPSADRLPTEPPVFGLCSNVAEWTTTFASLYPPMAHIEAIPRSQAREQRVVRGPYGKPLGEREPGDYDPRGRRFASKHTLNEGLGFRCVRSARPRLEASDFPPLPVINTAAGPRP